jgi:hypothetical protein
MLSDYALKRTYLDEFVDLAHLIAQVCQHPPMHLAFSQQKFFLAASLALSNGANGRLPASKPLNICG